MTTLFLDLSGRNTRAILTDGQHLAALTIDRQEVSPEAIDRLLVRIAARTGRRIAQAHLIIPDREIIASTFKLQQMPLPDAVKIIRRRLGAPPGENTLLPLPTAFDLRNNQQTYLVEQCSRQTTSRYLDSFAAARIRLLTLTTPLQALFAAITTFRRDMASPQAVFHIDNDVVTAVFLTSNEILHYSRTTLTPDRDDPVETDEAERARKRRLFDILNALHNICTQYLLDNPRLTINKVWLCGADATISGLPQSLAEATDLEVALLNPFPTSVENAPAYTALAGLMQVCTDLKRGNFIVQKQFLARLPRPGVLKKAIVGGMVVGMLILIVVTEIRVANNRNDLKAASQTFKELQATAPEVEAFARNVDFLKKIDGRRVPFHDILRDLAEHLPDTVMLDRIRYDQRSDRGRLELMMVAAAPDTADRGTVLSDIAGTLARSPHLTGCEDPVIGSVRESGGRLMQIAIICSLQKAEGVRR